jgi:hypothetical protein
MTSIGSNFDYFCACSGRCSQRIWSPFNNFRLPTSIQASQYWSMLSRCSILLSIIMILTPGLWTGLHSAIFFYLPGAQMLVLTVLILFNVTCTLSFNISSNFALLSRDFDLVIALDQFSSSVREYSQFLNSTNGFDFWASIGNRIFLCASTPTSTLTSCVPGDIGASFTTCFGFHYIYMRLTRLYINMCLLIFRSPRKKRNEGKGATTASKSLF